MTDEGLKKQMALFRFSLIAPVVAGTYQEASKIAYFRVAAATVSLFNVSYEVPRQYIGHTIHLRCRPEDMSEIYIYDGEGGKRLHTSKPVRKQDNANRKRRANISYGAMDGGEAAYV